MTQNRLQSLIEACINTLIGFAVSYAAWPPIAAIVGIPFGHGQHLTVVLLFTVISVVRSYVVRRYFNARLSRMAAALAARRGGDQP